MRCCCWICFKNLRELWRCLLSSCIVCSRCSLQLIIVCVILLQLARLGLLTIKTQAKLINNLCGKPFALAVAGCLVPYPTQSRPGVFLFSCVLSLLETDYQTINN